MRTKIAEVDINHLNRIDGLADYDAVRIILKSGVRPVDQIQIPCNSSALEKEDLQSIIGDYKDIEPSALVTVNLPAITVAICTHNRPDHLKKALTSIVNQVYQPQEVIVIDNAGQEIVEAITHQIIPDARYLIEKCPGLDFARNLAVASATSEIIAFLDDDVQADPHWVMTIAQIFETHPEAGGVTGPAFPLELETKSQHVFEAHGIFNRGFERRILPDDTHRKFGMELPKVVQAVKAGSGCNMAFRTSVLREIGYFDEALDTGPSLPGGGDLDIFYRTLVHGYKVVYEPGAYVYHLHRRSAKHLNYQMLGHQRGFLAYLTKALWNTRGWQKIGVAAYIGWRIFKTGVRPFFQLIGLDKLPFFILIRMFVGCILGLGSYPASKARNYKYTREISKDNKSNLLHFLDLWNNRELVWNLTVRDLKVKYKKSLLGFVWTLLNPILVVSILISVFSYIVRIPISNYWAFLISGYFVYNFFSSSLNGGIQTTVGNAYLTKSSVFPQEVLIFSSVLSRFFEFILELLIVVTILIIFHHNAIPLSFVMIFPLLLILLLITIGLVLPLAALAIYFSDAFQIIPIFTLVLFYLSPVFYNIDLVPIEARHIYLLNPMALLLNEFHTVLYAGGWPNFGVLLLLMVLSFTVFYAGYTVFNRKKREFAEII